MASNVRNLFKYFVVLDSNLVFLGATVLFEIKRNVGTIEIICLFFFH